MQPCALSPNTHTGRVAVKRVNQILKLPLSPAPPQKRRQKAFFSPGDFLHPTFIIQALFFSHEVLPVEEMEKLCWISLDLFSVVKILLVPFTGCPANVTDSVAPPTTMHTHLCRMLKGQCGHNE